MKVLASKSTENGGSEMSSVRVCLLLGSNIEPMKNLPKALGLLAKEVVILKRSSVWESTAIGSDGPDFLNAALLIETTLTSEALKKNILAPIEQSLGRVRSSDKNAPRTIDIDIVMYDEVVVDDELTDYEHIRLPVSEVVERVPRPDPITLKHVPLTLWRIG